jgi:hypothetical protein
MRLRLAIAVLTAVVCATPMAVSTPAMAIGQSGPLVTNFVITQRAAINAAQTSYPVTVSWTNGASYAKQILYRDDVTTGTSTAVTTLVGGAGAHSVSDAISLNGPTGDASKYHLATFVANKVLGNTSTAVVHGSADDDDFMLGYLTGTWTRKTLAGATQGHYRARAITEPPRPPARWSAWPAIA